METALQNLVTWLVNQFTWWDAVGWVGQLLFTMRFIYQWIHSERSKQSVVPEIFWYFSLAGGLVLFIYTLHVGKLVLIIGQGAGTFIYLRNIQLIWRNKKRLAAEGANIEV